MHSYQYPNLTVRVGSHVVIKCANNTQHSRVLTKFGYSRQCIKCIQNSRILTKFGYSHQCTKCIQNFQNSRVLTKFRYSRQCTKFIPNFLNCKVSECQYPNIGYYDLSQNVRVSNFGIFFSIFIMSESILFIALLDLSNCFYFIEIHRCYWNLILVKFFIV